MNDTAPIPYVLMWQPYYTACARCGRATRPAWAPRDGWSVRYKARGRCQRCYLGGLRAGYRVRTKGVWDERLDEYVALRAMGISQEEIPQRLGVSRSTFTRAILRARARGDARAAGYGPNTTKPRSRSNTAT